MQDENNENHETVTVPTTDGKFSTIPNHQETYGNQVGMEFDAELRLVTTYKEKIQNSTSTLSKTYYQNKLNKQVKRVLRILAVLESANPTMAAIKDKIK